jgi:FtsP/CotA-like multicopper oxidase with cupredoxin domain
MRKRTSSILMLLAVIAFAVGWSGPASAGQNDAQKRDNAIDAVQQAVESRAAVDPQFNRVVQQITNQLEVIQAGHSAKNLVPSGSLGFNPAVNYNLPNFSQSPNVRKFVDALPGLGAYGCTPGTGTAPNVTGGTCGQNNLGQYIPVASPTRLTTDGSAYYEIAAKNYGVQMNSDLPPTNNMRGYTQCTLPNDGTGTCSATLPNQYGGPLIVTREYNPNLPPGLFSSGNPFGTVAGGNTGNASCTGPGQPVSCCTGAGAGTCPTYGNGWAVRLKFFNELPVSSAATIGNAYLTCGANGTNPLTSPNQCLPVDITLEEGKGPLGPAPYGTTSCDMGTAGSNCDLFTMNRVTIPHLHGGRTPWISDGTPQQWITPLNDPIPSTAIAGYPNGMAKGTSFLNVPDMITGTGSATCVGGGYTCFAPSAHDGIGTNYYSNQQSGRLMFWHDHISGQTRVNVYSGLAADYLLVSQTEDDLIDGTNYSGVFTKMGATPASILPSQAWAGPLYRYGIPLIIQDKAFVNDASTDALRSPNFPSASYTPTGHTYETSAACWPGGPQAVTPPGTGYLTPTNTPANCGSDPLWYKYVGAPGGNLWMPHEYMPIENIYDPTGNTTNGRWDYSAFMIPPMWPQNLTLPSPTSVPESFGDTAIVNGTAFPYLTVAPDLVRFRILSVGNDRAFNLQWYKAQPVTAAILNGGSGYHPATTTVAFTGCATAPTGTVTVSTGTITGFNIPECTGYIGNGNTTVTLHDATSSITCTGTSCSGTLASGGTCSFIQMDIAANTTGMINNIVPVGCTGFTAVPTVTINSNSGGSCIDPNTQAAANVTANYVASGVVTGITVTSQGVCSSAPGVNITDSNGTPGTGAQAVVSFNTEVAMVPASPNPNYPTWPIDGRDGGVPDPTTQGPAWWQIGNESGFMAQAQVVPNQPIDFEYNRQSIPFAGVTSHSLYLLPDQRADVLVDFRPYAGQTLIMYNDSPAPTPMGWAINDYYTDDPDYTGAGGQPSTPPGYGPNTRTVMQVRVLATMPSGTASTTTLAQIQQATPAAFATDQPAPIVPQTVYNTAEGAGFAPNGNIYAQAPDNTLNVTGAASSIQQILTTAGGNGYTATTAVNGAPNVTIISANGQGSGAVAGACINPMGAVTLVSGGVGCANLTSATVTFGAPNGAACTNYTVRSGVTNYTMPCSVPATGVASVSGNLVQAISVLQPGCNYSTTSTVAPTCTITMNAGATCTTAPSCTVFAPATAGMVGSINVLNPGSGYTVEPRVLITPAAGNNLGQGATAVALIGTSPTNTAIPFTYKNIVEGFEPWYGRMTIQLGSTPNALTPNVGNGLVVGAAHYVDPPTEIFNDGDTVVWRLTHLGVDTHSLHFHLFDVQVVNRVDYSNVVKPPYPDEIGWRDTIRTNPMEDIIVAFRPRSMWLPFSIPSSTRPLDPSTPIGSTTNFLPAAPPAGVAAVQQVSNVLTNFGWEYVWHCHMLDHEDNDFMRAMVMNVTPPTTPAGLYATVTGTCAAVQVTLNWSATSNNAATYNIQRSTSNTFPVGPSTVAFTVNGFPAATSFVDTTASANTTYYYRVQAQNAGGTSGWSTTYTLSTVLPPTGLASTPANLAVSAGNGTDTATLSWTACGTPISYTVQRLDFMTGIVTYTTTTTSLVNTGLVPGNTYWYRVRANVSATLSSPYTSSYMVFAP